MTGYYIEGRDDEVGHVEDLLVDGRLWVIRYFIVDTRNWWPGKKVLIATSWVSGIDWSKTAVRVDRTRAEIKAGRSHDPFHRSTMTTRRGCISTTAPLVAFAWNCALSGAASPSTS